MTTSDRRTQRLLICVFAFALGAVAGWVFVEMLWHRLTRGVMFPWGNPHRQAWDAFSLISTLSGAMIGWGLALPPDDQDE